MRKQYLSAPLPFQGQKRMFAKEYIKVLQQYKDVPGVVFLVELCDWMGKNKTIGNPFENCQRREFNAHMNYSASYTDIMLYTKAA